MVNIEIKVNGTSIVANSSMKITSGLVGATFSIEYDEAWTGLKQKVIFKADNLSRIADGNVIPFEVLRLPNKTLFVGIEGRNEFDEVVVPTIWFCLGKILPGANGEIPASTTPVIGGGSTGGGGTDGTTFYPSVSEDGVISWKNDGGKKNPEPVDLRAAVIASLPVYSGEVESV